MNDAVCDPAGGKIRPITMEDGEESAPKEPMDVESSLSPAPDDPALAESQAEKDKVPEKKEN